MKKMIIRNDDVGFSDVYNIGTFETIEHGLATSADIMLDSPGTEDALRRLKAFPWISVGWHTHMWGAPVLPTDKVSSLVEQEGEFAGRFRADLFIAEDVVYEEALSELRAQIDRCIEIIGRVPDTCNFMGGNTPFKMALGKVLDEYNIVHDFALKKCYGPEVMEKITKAQLAGEKWAKYYNVVGLTDHQPNEKWAHRNILIADGGLPYIDLYTDSVTEVEEKYDPVLYYTEDRAKLLEYPDDVIVEQSWHPGYMDYYVYRLGERNLRDRARQFTVGRVQDVAALCSKRLRDWVIENQIELINFRDALYGTSEYQNHLKNIGSDLYMLK
jgi:predicted glycoside hydrolase/deacetylase ChbG (UPF0249 family)